AFDAEFWESVHRRAQRVREIVRSEIGRAVSELGSSTLGTGREVQPTSSGMGVDIPSMQRRAMGPENEDQPVAVLVAAAAQGDEEAWGALIDRFAGLVSFVIQSYNLGAADATNVSQTTWLRLVENIDRIQKPE